MNSIRILKPFYNPFYDYMRKQLTENEIRDFQSKIFDWWNDNKRRFPWRETTDPYKIMVSEFMLQQTQANRVIQKYLDFIAKFPTLESLSVASTSDIIKMWSGLGYNRRVLWLQEAATKINSLGFFPKTLETLKRMKGIGDYTSRSILIFAFNFDIATVDTNIRRILIVEGFASETHSDKELLLIASKLLPEKNSRNWHNALMDYASIELTSSKTGIRPKSTQSKFRGSNRQIRGKILKKLTIENKINLGELVKELDITIKHLEIVIDSLVKDKIIIIKNDTIEFAENRLF